MNSAVYFVCIVFCIVEYQCTESNAVELSQSLLDAIRYVESGGDVCALGDSTIGTSLGAYQITHEYYQDAVEANATLTVNGQGILMFILYPCSPLYARLASLASLGLSLSGHQACCMHWLNN